MDKRYSFVIAGIGFALNPKLSQDENRPVIEDFILRHKDTHEEIALLLEKDNQKDDKAIGVYLNSKRIGYVGSECDNIRTLMDDQDHEGVAFAVIDGQHSPHSLDAHLVDPETVNFRMHFSKRIADKPYSSKLWISFTEEERARDAIFVEMTGCRSDKLTSPQWLDLIKSYCSKGYINVCCEETFILKALLNRFEDFPDSDEYICECLSLLKSMNSKYHNLKVKANTLSSAYSKVKLEYGNTFTDKFEEWRFSDSVYNHLNEAVVTRNELKHWLIESLGSVFSGYPWNWSDMASYIESKNYNRRDVYTIFEVMILIDWLTDVLKPQRPAANTIPPELAHFPKELTTTKAVSCLRTLQKHKILDNNFFPITTNKQQAAVIASALSNKLGIDERWKVFEGAWNLTRLGNKYQKTAGKESYESFESQLNKILERVILG